LDEKLIFAETRAGAGFPPALENNAIWENISVDEPWTDQYYLAVFKSFFLEDEGRPMLERWMDRIFNKRTSTGSAVSCHLHFNRRSRRRLIWKRVVSRSA